MGHCPRCRWLYDKVPECDESNYINAVLSQGGLEPHYFPGEQAGPLPYLGCDPWEHDDPFDAPSSYYASLAELVRGLDVRIALDGVDGDTTVCHGYGRLPELFRSGHWRELMTEVQAISGSLRCGIWGLLWRKGIKPLTPAGIRRTWRFLSGRGERPWGRDTFINRDFATRISLKERFHALQAHRLGPPGNSRQSHWHEVTWGGIIHQIESTNKAAARFGIELRHPFRDRRLMEFCLALPAEQKLHKGLNRMVMRRAMAGIVPEEMYAPGDKVDFRPEHQAIGCCSWSRSGCGGSDTGAVQKRSVSVRMTCRRLRSLFSDSESVPQRKLTITCCTQPHLAQWLTQSGLIAMKQTQHACHAQT